MRNCCRHLDLRSFQTEFQIRGGIEDNSKIIFLKEKIDCDLH